MAARKVKEQSVVLKWHPYPDEKPKKDGKYIVTSMYGNVSMRYYSCEGDQFNGGLYNAIYRGIVAWADLPDRYILPDEKERYAMEMLMELDGEKAEIRKKWSELDAEKDKLKGQEEELRLKEKKTLKALDKYR